jgi:hypothetical protein
MSPGLVGCTREEVIEFDDDITDEDLEEELKTWVWENLDTFWRKV